MKHKVGDKVQIKSKEWYNKRKDYVGTISFRYSFVFDMSRFCGKTATITKVGNDFYRIDIDPWHYRWIDEMFEEDIKDMETKEIILPKGWEVDKIENGKIILKESKEELPKTWEECCKLIKEKEYITSNSVISKIDFENISDRERNSLPISLGKPMLALCQLLTCREVYRQGWKPDWSSSETKYCIEYSDFKVCDSCSSYISKILSFQSREIRDKFLENFKDLIEEAKEMI